MSLDEALDAMHAARKKAFDHLSRLILNLPEPGDIKADLEKQKTEKDFKKALNQWKAKLHVADLAHVELEPDAIDSWNNKIQEAMKARTELGKKNDATEKEFVPLEEKIKSILSSPLYDLVYKPALGGVIEKISSDLKVQRKSFDAATEAFKDAGDDIDAQKKFVGTVSERTAFYNKRRIAANDEYLKNNKYKGNASKAGNKR